MRNIIVFDLDDTLFSETDYVISGFRAAAKWLSSKRDCKGMFEECRGIFESGARGNIFNLALERLQIPPEPELIQQLIEAYRSHVPEISLYKDARWALDFFREKCPTALLTDGYLLPQQRKVAALGINDRFNAIVYTDALGREHWKPSPVPYLKIMELIPSAMAKNYIYVSDNPQKDFVAPRALGWQTIQIARRDGLYSSAVVDKSFQADQVIDSLTELRDL